MEQANFNNKDFVIRESKSLASEEQDDKKKSMFIPDFDVNDVPPLE